MSKTTPAHIAERRKLLTAGAKLRPCGSINRKVLAASRGTTVKHILACDVAAQKIAFEYSGLFLASLSAVYDAMYRSEGSDVESLLAEAITWKTGALICPVGTTNFHLVSVLDLSRIKIKSTGQKPFIMVVLDTLEGEIAVSENTLFIPDRALFEKNYAERSRSSASDEVPIQPQSSQENSGLVQ